MSNPPSSFTQYCDDVRREADGRPSLMGVYPSNAVIDLDRHETLPKVCAYTVISLPFGNPLDSVSVVSSWNDEEVERVDIPEEVIANFNQKQEQDQETKKKHRLLLATVLEIRDLDIGDGGALRTRVLVNNSEIEMRTLRLQPQRGDVTPSKE